MRPAAPRRLAAVVLVVPLMLSGCSGDGDPEPKFSQAPSVGESSAEPSVSASPSESAEPESAEEFVRRWFKAGDEMQNTGDATRFRSLSKNCLPCDRLVDRVTAIYRDGGYIKIGSTRVKNTMTLARQPKTQLLEVRIAAPPGEYAENADAPPKQLSGETARYRVTLRRASPSGEWTMFDYASPTS